MPPSTTGTILFVEDDASVRDAVSEFLSQHGFTVHVASDGLAADRHMTNHFYNLVILDLMLPGEDGLSICRRLSATGVSILMVSALGSTDDRITGLDEGASDYLAKPFEPRELLARVKAILRRNSPDRIVSTPSYLFCGLRYDPADALLSDANGNLVVLTAGELRLLGAFVERPGRLLSRDILLDLTHGEYVGPLDRAVDLAVSRLRRKLIYANASETIETVRGLGYRFVAPVSRT